MRTLKFLTAITAVMFAGFIFTSCGGGDKKANPPRTLAYTQFKIENKDKDLFKMVDGGKTDIAFDTDGELKIICKFELLKTYTGNATQAIVTLYAFDSNDTRINIAPSFGNELRSDDNDGSLFLDFLKGAPGSTKTMVFKGAVTGEGFKTDIPATQAAAKNIVAFEVVTDYEGTETNAESTSNDNSSASDDNSDSDTSTDGLIKSYTGFIDQYIKIVGHIKKGDEASASVAEDMFHKVDDLTQKLDAEKGNMTTEQVQKLLKLDTKFNEAIADMQGRR